MLYNLFDYHAKNQPYSPAIITPYKRISYSELYAYTIKIVDYLYDFQIRKGELIAIIMDKGWEQVATVLGIIKLGAAYLPIDPSESPERINTVLATGRVKILLTQDKYKSSCKLLNIKSVLCIEQLLSNKSSKAINKAHKLENENQLAYVIFTSGSTGIPKGVMITHRSVNNTILDINLRYNVNNHDKIFAISNLVFDLSVYDIFGILSAGGTIVIGEDFIASNISAWEKLFFDSRVSIWNSVPSIMEIYLDFSTTKYTKCPDHNLRLVLLSGDWIPVTLPQKIWDFFGYDVQIVSLGGATEASIWSILYNIDKVDSKWKSIPYGKSMTNQKFIILDNKLEEIETGQIGELFIAGEGLAQGYLHNKKLTKYHFLQHPKQGRIYRTGDLGRYLKDGNIEFLGRVDAQVKISGYRIELNAIRSFLIKHQSVNQAVVTPFTENGVTKLAAYITLNKHFYFSYTKFSNNQITDWKNVYETLFHEENLKNSQSELNTAGWISSYNNKEIPAIQMAEWLNNTVMQILSLNPRNILEIGCGSGMLIFKISDKVNQYDAVDISSEAISYIKTILEKTNTKNVNLLQLEALDIDNIHATYDVIILNSVIQYFPSIEYLTKVIEKCINLLQPGGYIYIGDIRNLEYLKEFYSSLLLDKGYNSSNYIELQNLLDYLVSEEKELVISHNFFYFLKTINKNISHVEVLLKDGVFKNEMNCFRYNVILRINNSPPQTNIIWTEWSNSPPNEYIEQKLSKNIDYIAIKNIPNNRIAGLHQISYEQFPKDKDWQTWSKEIIFNAHINSVSPEFISNIAKKYGYHVVNTWSKKNGYFDVIIKKQNFNLSFDNSYISGNTEFSNSPLIPMGKKQLIQQLRKFLMARLPSYMIPTYFVILFDLPVTQNGKIAYNLLPPPKISVINMHNYTMPSNEIEKIIAEIWQDILGIDKISTDQNFYEIGGNSLLIIRIITNINKIFKTTIELKYIKLKHITIQNIAEIVKGYLHD